MKLLVNAGCGIVVNLRINSDFPNAKQMDYIPLTLSGIMIHAQRKKDITKSYLEEKRNTLRTYI